MNKELIKKNKQMREKRPLISSNVIYSTYENNGIFQICFKSKGCPNYLNGFCIMCDYGVGVNIIPNELEIAFDKALSESKCEIKVLLLNSFGSLLEESEISEECFNALLKKIKKTDIKNIIFETHYATITATKLDQIKNVLFDKNVSFELGLETSNQQIRENNLLKYIDNSKFIDTIHLIHSYDMEIIANIIIGVPFLSDEEQVSDAIESIRWCFDNDIDEVVLFPMNIRPYTLLMNLYQQKKYKIISHWMLIEVLSKVPEYYLKDISIAWYGNRDLPYENDLHSIFPTSCELCKDDLSRFYELFLKNKDSVYRKNLINSLIAVKKCKCYRRID